MKTWDVFISHASEDKDAVARPLAECLQKAGLQVWLDSMELKLGDSLRAQIDRGLSKSRFGVVILSRQFFAKGWPQRELNGLFALEEDGRKTILPVWHQVTKAEVAAQSPMLADRLAANTADGTVPVARAIIDVVLATNDAPSTTSPTALRLLLNILERDAEPSEILEFLRWHQSLLTRLTVSPMDSSPYALLVDTAIGGVPVPFALVKHQPSLAYKEVTLVTVGRATGALLAGESLVTDVDEAMGQLSAALNQADEGAGTDVILEQAGTAESVKFDALVFARRREALSGLERGYLRERHRIENEVSYYRWCLSQGRLRRVHGWKSEDPPAPAIPHYVQYSSVALRTYDALLDGSFQ